ncbi:hypothetical protein [Sphingopyxis sp.]|uniref:hypothetical protein n=1 Tax=Sphingopyxis sp. TaxID=1908224 RepID=UPI003D095FB6
MGRMLSGHFRKGAVALALCATTAPASAEEIENVRSLAMQVQGRVAEQCSIGRIEGMDFGDLTKRGKRASARIPFNCNVPFEVKVQSRFGGLAHVEQPQGEGPYAGVLPYSIGLQVAVRRPQSGVVSRTYQSADLRGGQQFSSAGGIASDGIAVDVALGQPSSDAGLLAGRYREVIEITISPI